MDNDYNFTRSAAQRRAQRSIRERDLALMLTAADQEFSAFGEAMKIGLSRDAARRAIEDGSDEAMVRRAMRLVAVVSERGDIITVFRRKASRIDGRGRFRAKLSRWGR